MFTFPHNTVKKVLTASASQQRGQGSQAMKNGHEGVGAKKRGNKLGGTGRQGWQGKVNQGKGHCGAREDSDCSAEVFQDP